jgi:hypothetical protein
LVEDPDAPDGKLLALDPAGPGDQRPRQLSGGWNNPFAFAVRGDGARLGRRQFPGHNPERSGRGDGLARDDEA